MHTHVQNVHTVVEVESLGEGMVAYFVFLKLMIALFSIMAILVAPIIASNYQGKRIPENLAGNGLSRFSIVNAGVGSSPSCFLSFGRENGDENMNTCLSSLNRTIIPTVNMSLNEYYTLIVYIDILYTILAIFVVQVVFYFIHHKIARDADFHTCSITDYSVVVSGIPKDQGIEKKEILDFFNDNYALSNNEEDFRNATKVTHNKNTNDDIYLDTWIAEIQLVYDEGILMEAFETQQNLFAKIRRYRRCQP